MAVSIAKQRLYRFGATSTRMPVCTFYGAMLVDSVSDLVLAEGLTRRDRLSTKQLANKNEGAQPAIRTYLRAL